MTCREEAQEAQDRRRYCAGPDMNTDDIMRLCDIVRETGFAIHKYLRHGHAEKIYENALVHRLSNKNIEVQQQWPLVVHDEDGYVWANS